MWIGKATGPRTASSWSKSKNSPLTKPSSRPSYPERRARETTIGNIPLARDRRAYLVSCVQTAARRVSYQKTPPPAGHPGVPSASSRGARPVQWPRMSAGPTPEQSAPVWKILAKSQAGSWQSPWPRWDPSAFWDTVFVSPLWQTCTFLTGTCALPNTGCGTRTVSSNTATKTNNANAINDLFIVSPLHGLIQK